jgi:anti-sigma factor RsiW
MKHDHDGDCRELLMRMAQGVEGDLSPAERRALARHLAGCKRCGEFSESLKRTVQLCREAGAPTMSARAQARARANVSRLLSRRITKSTKATTSTKKRPKTVF